MRDWLATPVPRDMPEAWGRLDRYVVSVPDLKPLLLLPNGEPIIVDGPTRVPHGVVGKVPQSAFIQTVGAIITNSVSLEEIDSDYLYLDSTESVRVHILVLL